MKRYSVTEIANKIEGMNYFEAIQWVESMGGIRDSMGVDAIARFKIDHPNVFSLMFYNYYPEASRPTFGFKHQKISYC